MAEGVHASRTGAKGVNVRRAEVNSATSRTWSTNRATCEYSQHLRWMTQRHIRKVGSSRPGLASWTAASDLVTLSEGAGHIEGASETGCRAAGTTGAHSECRRPGYTAG